MTESAGDSHLRRHDPRGSGRNPQPGWKCHSKAPLRASHQDGAETAAENMCCSKVVLPVWRAPLSTTLKCFAAGIRRADIVLLK